MAIALVVGLEDMYWPVSPVALLIKIPARRGLYLRLGFGSEGFFNYSISIISISAFFINSQPNKELNIIIKVLI